jgi:4-hydroxyphenylpyruvate dioxygenase
MEIDRIRFYVRDATRIRGWLVSKLGLQILADRSNAHTVTHLVGNAHLSIEISSPLNSASPVADYLKFHPPGVKDISFRVGNLAEIRHKIDRLGVKMLATSIDSIHPPWVKIQGWGAIEHTIVQSSNDRRSALEIAPDEMITGIDHLVLNVATGELEAATRWYENLFEFQVQQIFKIQTDRSGLASKALTSLQGKIKFNINEPTSPNSQIQEFLDTNRGAGIQHIALQTNHILDTVDRMQQQGLAFLSVPATYYPQLKLRARHEGMLSLTGAEWQTLERLQILVDWQQDRPQSLLMQTFTQPIFDEPTFFFEIIERREQAEGFGQGNFQALFEAIEQNHHPYQH